MTTEVDARNRQNARRSRLKNAQAIALFLDLSAILAAFIISSWVFDCFLDKHMFHQGVTRPLKQQVIMIVCVIALWLLIIQKNRGYEFHIIRSMQRGIFQIAKASIYFIATIAIIQELTHLQLVRRYILVGVPLALILLSVGRQISARLVRIYLEKNPVRLAVLGRVADINQVIEDSGNNRIRFHELATIILLDPENKHRLLPHPHAIVVEFNPKKTVYETVVRHQCDSLLLASVSDFDSYNLRRIAWDLQELDVRLYLEPPTEGVIGTRIHAEQIGNSDVLYIERHRHQAANGWLKRAIDISFSCFALLVLSPIMIVIAILIKVDDGGPIFYVSERIGKKGEPFKFYKFRSMSVDADKKADALIKEQGGGALLFKMKDDPRVTKIGKFIRKYSIDELPQFFNVINGTMSVVGPRPQVQREVNEYGDLMRKRLEVRPGITGLWQVSGRSDLTPKQAESLDLFYVENWSPGLDTRIVISTVKEVIAPSGAY